MSLHRTRWPAVLLLALYFLAAAWMAFTLPPYGTPNELLNYEYVQVMRQIRGLPNRGLVDSEIRYTDWRQPPVYFTFAALVGLPIPVPPSDVNPPPPIVVEPNLHYLSTERGNLTYATPDLPGKLPLLYTNRLAAALLGILGVAALYRAGATVVSPWAGLLMASLMAFPPAYLHLAGGGRHPRRPRLSGRRSGNDCANRRVPARHWRAPAAGQRRGDWRAVKRRAGGPRDKEPR